MRPSRGSPRGGRGRHSLADVVVELPLLAVQVRHRDVLQLLLHEAQPLLLHCNAERARAGHRQAAPCSASVAHPAVPRLLSRCPPRGRRRLGPASSAATCLLPRPQERGPGRPLTQVQPLGGNPDPAAGRAKRGRGQAGQQQQEEEAAAGSHLAPGGRARGQRGPARWGASGGTDPPGRDAAAAHPARGAGAARTLGPPRGSAAPRAPKPRRRPGPHLLSARGPAAPSPGCCTEAPGRPRGPTGSHIPRVRSSRLLRCRQRPTLPSSPNRTARREPCAWCGSGEPSTARGREPSRGASPAATGQTLAAPPTEMCCRPRPRGCRAGPGAGASPSSSDRQSCLQDCGTVQGFPTAFLPGSLQGRGGRAPSCSGSRASILPRGPRTAGGGPPTQRQLSLGTYSMTCPRLPWCGEAESREGREGGRTPVAPGVSFELAEVPLPLYSPPAATPCGPAAGRRHSGTGGCRPRSAGPRLPASTGRQRAARTPRPRAERWAPLPTTHTAPGSTP